jgi:hypothetical protein
MDWRTLCSLEKRDFVSDTLNLNQKNYGLNPVVTVELNKYMSQTELKRSMAIWRLRKMTRAVCVWWKQAQAVAWDFK